MAERLKYLATDSRSLQELIQGGYLYVDKTEHLYQMIRKGSPSKYWFLARPRRFGKSLTVDTFLNIFSGCKELFKDTYIYDKHDFSSFPVIRLNMNNTDNYGLEEFLYTLKNNVILPVADELGVIGNFPFDAVTPSTWLNYLLDSVSKKYGKQVVVLIDEYDYPLLDSIPNKTFEEISKRIESFYSALKAREERIKFCFITGITRFSQVSIFSKLNNLIDISNDPDYTALCGYTDDEINRYFSSFFRQYFEKENIDSEEEKRKFRLEIKEYYDGYRFSLDSDISVYNPVSIGRFFTNGCRFENYWIETGAQSLVDKIITGHPELFREGTVFSVEEAATRTFKIDEIFSQNPVKDSIYSYLIQAGYLTMKCNDYGNIILDYPNREVRDTMNAKVIAHMV